VSTLIVPHPPDTVTPRPFLPVPSGRNRAWLHLSQFGTGLYLVAACLLTAAVLIGAMK
jgi:hypothetical protein